MDELFEAIEVSRVVSFTDSVNEVESLDSLDRTIESHLEHTAKRAMIGGSVDVRALREIRGRFPTAGPGTAQVVSEKGQKALESMCYDGVDYYWLSTRKLLKEFCIKESLRPLNTGEGRVVEIARRYMMRLQSEPGGDVAVYFDPYRSDIEYPAALLNDLQVYCAGVKGVHQRNLIDSWRVGDPWEVDGPNMVEVDSWVFQATSDNYILFTEALMTHHNIKWFVSLSELAF
jgi:hypothetical protein